MNVTQDKRGWNHELNKGGVTCDYRHFVALLLSSVQYIAVVIETYFHYFI